jgi:hypothetical protein
MFLLANRAAFCYKKSSAPPGKSIGTGIKADLCGVNLIRINSKGEQHMSQKKPELTFKYIFSDDYNPVYVNGAHGGVTPRGELVISFYLERQPLPNSITHELTASGTIGRESGAAPEDLNSSLVRFVSSGVVLNHQTAREIHFWLGEKLKEMEAIEQAKAALQGETPGGMSGLTH